MDVSKLLKMLESDQMMVKNEPEMGKKLMVFFGGLAGKLDMPHYDFLLVSNTISKDWNFLFVKDIKKSWYHSNYDDVVRAIQEYESAYDPEEIVTVGNSMGGYAAILFGHEINADRILSFIPQTCIEYDKKVKQWGDGNYEPLLTETRAKYPNRLFDLSEIEALPKTDIYYTNDNKFDRIQAENMKDVPGVVLHPLDLDGHHVVPHLLKEKQIVEVLTTGEVAQ